MLELVEGRGKDQEDVKELTAKDEATSSSNSLQSNKKVNQKHGAKQTKIYDKPLSIGTQIWIPKALKKAQQGVTQIWIPKVNKQVEQKTQVQTTTTMENKDKED